MAAPAFETIEVSVDGPRGEIALNRPGKLNPLSPHTLRELARAANWLDSLADLKVVTVRGRGRAFSAGADLAAFGGAEALGDGADAWAIRSEADAGRAMADTLEGMDAVTIASIHGHCVGGGLVLACACDLRIAEEGVRFAIPEVELGIPLAWGGIPRLVREIGPALTKELVMTCRPFGAQEAMGAGFLNRVVPPDQLDRAVDEMVDSLLSKPRLALLATKRHTNAVTEQMVGAARSWADADGLLAASADPEGRDAALRYLRRVRDEASPE